MYRSCGLIKDPYEHRIYDKEQIFFEGEVRSGSAPYLDELAKPDTKTAFRDSRSIQRIKTRMSRSINTKTSTPIQQLDQVSIARVSQDCLPCFGTTVA